jgi:serine/threonine-protein kinase RsbW
MSGQQLKKQYTSSLQEVDQLHTDVEQFLTEHEVERGTVNRIMLSISEAATNAVIHGNRSDESKKIELELFINQNWFLADISDEGSGGYASVTSRPRADLLAESGRGVDLINHYSDLFEYTELEHGGLKVSIGFDLKKHKKLQTHK